MTAEQAIKELQAIREFQRTGGVFCGTFTKEGMSAWKNLKKLIKDHDLSNSMPL